MEEEPKRYMGLKENSFRKVRLRNTDKLVGCIQREIGIGNPGKRGWKILEVKFLSI